MRNLTLVWQISSELDESKLIHILESYGGKKTQSDEYEIWRFKFNGLTTKCYEKTLVVQGTENEKNLRLVRDINNIQGLQFDSKNAEIYNKLFPCRHNAIFCMECKTPSLLIEAKIEGLDIVFKKECGHKNSMRPPLIMLNNRILPDINILISNHLSRLIKIGYFEDFEVVIPEFIMNVLDLLGSNKKKGAINEIEKLRSLENKQKITIFSSREGIEIPPSKKEFQQEEDNIILEIANLTNSILLTADETLKEKAVLNDRPTIFIHPRESKKLKIIDDVRNP